MVWSLKTIELKSKLFPPKKQRWHIHFDKKVQFVIAQKDKIVFPFRGRGARLCPRAARPYIPLMSLDAAKGIMINNWT